MPPTRPNKDRATAIHLLSFYLQQVYRAAGLHWTSDNDAEIEDLVDAILAASAAQE